MQYLQRTRASAHQPLLHCGTRAFLFSHTSFLHSRTKPPRTHSPFRANSPIQKPKLFHAALQNPRPAFDGRAAVLFTEIAAPHLTSHPTSAAYSIPESCRPCQPTNNGTRPARSAATGTPSRKASAETAKQTLQVFRCTECLHRFTGAPRREKSYLLQIILEGAQPLTYLGGQFPASGTLRFMPSFPHQLHEHRRFRHDCGLQRRLAVGRP